MPSFDGGTAKTRQSVQAQGRLLMSGCRCGRCRVGVVGEGDKLRIPTPPQRPETINPVIPGVATVLLNWLFRRKPEKAGFSDQLDLFEDRIRALERGQKRVTEALEELEDSATRRFGKLFSRLKRPEIEEPEPETPEVQAPNVRGNGGDAALLNAMRQRRALLSR